MNWISITWSLYGIVAIKLDIDFFKLAYHLERIKHHHQRDLLLYINLKT